MRSMVTLAAAGKNNEAHLLEIRLCFEITSPTLYPLQRLEKAKQSLVHRYVGTETKRAGTQPDGAI